MTRKQINYSAYMSNLTEEDESRHRVIEAFKRAEYIRFFDNAGVTMGYCNKKGFQFIVDELEHARKELAELKAENERIEQYRRDEGVKHWKQVNEQAATLKRYKDALEHLLTDFKKTNVHYQNQGYINFIQSALSGTKETE